MSRVKRGGTAHPRHKKNLKKAKGPRAARRAQEGGRRRRPQGAGRHRRPRPGHLRRHRRAGEGGAGGDVTSRASRPPTPSEVEMKASTLAVLIVLYATI